MAAPTVRSTYNCIRRPGRRLPDERRKPMSRRGLRYTLRAALAMAVIGPLAAAVGTALAATGDRAAGPGADAPVAGEVPGLTGPAAMRLAGAAADRFRQVTADRIGQHAAEAAGNPAPKLDEDLHDAWG